MRIIRAMSTLQIVTISVIVSKAGVEILILIWHALSLSAMKAVRSVKVPVDFRFALNVKQGILI